MSKNSSMEIELFVWMYARRSDLQAHTLWLENLLKKNLGSGTGWNIKPIYKQTVAAPSTVQFYPLKMMFTIDDLDKKSAQPLDELFEQLLDRVSAILEEPQCQGGIDGGRGGRPIVWTMGEPDGITDKLEGWVLSVQGPRQPPAEQAEMMAEVVLQLFERIFERSGEVEDDFQPHENCEPRNFTCVCDQLREYEATVNDIYEAFDRLSSITDGDDGLIIDALVSQTVQKIMVSDKALVSLGHLMAQYNGSGPSTRRGRLKRLLRKFALQILELFTTNTEQRELAEVAELVQMVRSDLAKARRSRLYVATHFQLRRQGCWDELRQAAAGAPVKSAEHYLIPNLLKVRPEELGSTVPVVAAFRRAQETYEKNSTALKMSLEAFTAAENAVAPRRRRGFFLRRPKAGGGPRLCRIKAKKQEENFQEAKSMVSRPSRAPSVKPE